MIYLSVIIPVYNREKTIEHCIECVVNQKFADLEILVIDDGSKDASLSLIRKWEKRDSRIRVIQKTNGGVASARNVGIQNASGKYVSFIDSDDFVNPDYLQRMVSAQKEYGENSLVISNIRQTNGVLYAKMEGQTWTIQEKDILKLFDAWLLESPCNKLFDRDYIQKEQICFREGIQLGEDFLFNMDYLMQRTFGRYIILLDNYYNYTVDYTSLSKSYYSDFFELQKNQYEHLYKLAQMKNVETSDYAIFWRRYYYRMLDALINTNRKENQDLWCVKICKNTKIIRDAMFQESVSWVENDMHKLSYIAYRTKSYLCVKFVDFMLEKVIFKLEKLVKRNGQ